MATKIVIDSASDINLNEANQLGLILMSLEVRFNDQVYKDGVDITPAEFYEKLIESSDLPQTSQLTPYCFDECFKKIADAGDDAVVITLSSKLSGTCAAAKQAAKKYPNKIFVVDSLNACIGERLLCQRAIKLLDSGICAAEIAQRLDKDKKRICLLALLDTLKYLKKGGRISAVTAIAGELLAIKPVISVVNGEVKLVGKAMGSKKGNNLLNTLVKEKGVDFSMPHGVIYSGTDDSLLKKYVADSAHIWQNKTDNLPVYTIGCTIGTHIGPGAIGVAFFEEEK